MKDVRSEFYINDHALLYALLAKNAEELCGAPGNEAAVKGTVLYARERGLRMAKRALADGKELTFRNYFLYKEWVDTKGWSKGRLVHVRPYHHQTLVCGWNETWKKYHLEKYGALYCSYVDENLVKGFNPELRLKLSQLLSHGDAFCDFNWGDVGFTRVEDVGALEKEALSKSASRTRDFLYHTAHVLSAMRRTFHLELGLVKGEKIAGEALLEYEKVFGREKKEALLKEAELDFTAV